MWDAMFACTELPLSPHTYVGFVFSRSGDGHPLSIAVLRSASLAPGGHDPVVEIPQLERLITPNVDSPAKSSSNQKWHVWGGVPFGMLQSVLRNEIISGTTWSAPPAAPHAAVAVATTVFGEATPT